ncbi:uncharacterized protein LOC135373169 [Ornithodoros turicata]|uniref:uncharacterized protein LOC135373169 n=1 Tax=Ornithodoros turicata TaxID=34597 RepID=UPI003139BB83
MASVGVSVTLPGGAMEKLDGTNYPTRSFMMTTFLKEQQLWKVINGDIPTTPEARVTWDNEDLQVLNVIVPTLSSGQTAYVINQISARGVWKKLEENLLLKSYVPWETLYVAEVASVGLQGLARSYYGVARSFDACSMANVTPGKVKYALLQGGRQTTSTDEAAAEVLPVTAGYKIRENKTMARMTKSSSRQEFLEGEFKIVTTPLAQTNVGRKKYKTKLDNRSKPVIFLGYCIDRKGYRFYDPQEKRTPRHDEVQYIVSRGTSTNDNQTDREEIHEHEAALEHEPTAEDGNTSDEEDGNGNEPEIRQDIELQVDTGSKHTVLDHQSWLKLGKPELSQPKYSLQGFNQNHIALKGQGQVDVSYQGRSHRLEIVVTESTHTNLLGREWIEKLGVDLNGLFVGAVDSLPGSFATGLQSHKDLFRKELGRCQKIKVHLQLKADATPKFFKPRPIPFALRSQVEEDLDRQVRNGVLTPIEYSDWATPIVVVPKPNGAVRVCGDFSVSVHPQLDVTQYPLPRPEELFAKPNGGQKFSKLDLSEAYLQMELDEEAEKVLVITTHRGLFQFNRMPFGIASAPAIFQRTMEQITAGLDDVACYLDDIIVTGCDDNEQKKNLETVLLRLQEYGFVLKEEKCAFLQEEVEYLGQVVSATGFSPSPKKVSAVLNMPEPTNVSEPRAFLGMVQHYSKFIPGLADLSAPLNKLLRKNKPWCWSEECIDAFDGLKQRLTAVDALTHFDPKRPIYLAADASSERLGAVIYHNIDGKEKPIAHASKTLSVAEKNYAQIEKEALAIIFGLKKFHQYLWGRKFTLFTDHTPLTTIFGPKKGIPVTAANRLQRWALIMMGHVYDIQYKPTQLMGNADGLSRLAVGPDHDFQRQISSDNIVEFEDVNVVSLEVMSVLPVTATSIAEETLERRSAS